MGLGIRLRCFAVKGRLPVKDRFPVEGRCFDRNSLEKGN